MTIQNKGKMIEFDDLRSMVSNEVTQAVQAENAILLQEMRSLVAARPVVLEPGEPIPTTISTSSPPTCVSATTYAAFRTLIPDAQFRSPEQASATELIARRLCHVLAVLPTGGGKSITYLTSAKREASKSMTTIYLAPLRALVDDQARVCSKYRIQCAKWEGRGDGVVAGTYGLVMGTYDVCENTNFIEYVQRMAKQGRIGRIVIDEAHYPHQNVGFRANMAQLTDVTRMGLPVVMLTATLPPVEVDQMCKFLHIPRDHIVEVRARTSRTNMYYDVKRQVYAGEMKDYPRRARHAIECFESYIDRQHIELGKECLGLLYVGSKALTEAIRDTQAAHTWGCYYGDMSPAEREKTVKDLGTKFYRMVCTGAFSMGVDNPHVDFVMHYDVPWSITDFVQESGRAGRAGQQGYSVVILTDDKPSTMGSDARQKMAKALYERQCRRMLLDEHMDGLPLTCFTHGPGTVLCHICHHEEWQAGKVKEPVIPPIGPIIAAGYPEERQRATPPLSSPTSQRSDWHPMRKAGEQEQEEMELDDPYDNDDVVEGGLALPETPRSPTPPPPPPPKPKPKSAPPPAPPVALAPPRPKPVPLKTTSTAGPSGSQSTASQPKALPRPKPLPAPTKTATTSGAAWPSVASRTRTSNGDGPQAFGNTILKYVRDMKCSVCVITGHGPPAMPHTRLKDCPNWPEEFTWSSYIEWKNKIKMTDHENRPRICVFCWLPPTALDYHSKYGGSKREYCFHGDKVLPMLYAMWQSAEGRAFIKSGALGYEIRTLDDWATYLSLHDNDQKKALSINVVRMFTVEIPKWLSAKGKWPKQLSINTHLSIVAD